MPAQPLPPSLPPVPTKAWALKQAGRMIGREVADQARPKRRRAVPRSAGGVTPEWLSAGLCRDLPGARVRSIASLEASAGTTTRRVLRVTYNAAGSAAGLPTRLFVKSTSTVAQRLMLGLGGFSHVEPAFYAQVRPRLAIEAPHGYFGAVDARSWRSIIVLEDVRQSRGASFCSPATAITRGRIEDLLNAAATWHGGLWESPSLSDWTWLRTPAAHLRLIDSLIGIADRRPAGARRALPVLPPALRNRQEDLYEGMRRSMELASRGPHTYLHGDLHVANTYLTRQGRMGVVDWQVGLRGSWAHDFAYLMATALTIEDRRAWEEELLDFYLDQLRAAGGGTIPRAAAWLAYRQATFYPYFAWTYTLGRSRLQPRFQPDEVSLSLIARISGAIEDLESLSSVGL